MDGLICRQDRLGNQRARLSRLFSFTGEDEPPVSRAGKDVVLQLPTDGVVLDGRESTDDHAIVLYEWTLQQGDPSSVDMKVTLVDLAIKTNISGKWFSVMSFAVSP